MPKKNTEPHQAVKGLVHYLNHVPLDARDGGVSSELARRSGMTKAQMYEYIGSKAGVPKPPTEEEEQVAGHFTILGK